MHKDTLLFLNNVYRIFNEIKIMEGVCRTISMEACHRVRLLPCGVVTM